MRLDHITPKQSVLGSGPSVACSMNAVYGFPNSGKLVLHLSIPACLSGLPGGYSEWEPPDSIPNSVVKLLSADDSVGFPHVKVGHRQALDSNPCNVVAGVFYSSKKVAEARRACGSSTVLLAGGAYV